MLDIDTYCHESLSYNSAIVIKVIDFVVNYSLGHNFNTQPSLCFFKASDQIILNNVK
ncbi:hypothetical protein VCHA54P500_10210 [Vibrio chagasii]|nr:hypothetical protein VCHA34P117_10170 [Vibrio chagasii]CAH7024032.1 hypothetical protein VCHA48P439_10210 [Vibrio chagasii]CAH7030388.1 hypothetical protein VCHA40O236_10170 [Vibrio chagasii]CAH7088651.1 hypothetical protein VCHA54P500_10210 [Vibrio chagasii]CAH7273930.1 hypothetical protein VCHA53O462_10210 [Vibrio chagasii]